MTDLLTGVRPEQLAAPTPCGDWNVGELIEHLLAVEARIEALGARGDVSDMPRQLPLPEGDLADGFRAAAAEALAPWTDDRLTALVTEPWGQVPGAAALGGYVREHLAHGWDLAVATGQNPEADPALASAVLALTRQFLPAEPRGGFIPFDPVVASAPDAGPTEQLANWLGRVSR